MFRVQDIISHQMLGTAWTALMVYTLTKFANLSLTLLLRKKYNSQLVTPAILKSQSVLLSLVKLFVIWFLFILSSTQIEQIGRSTLFVFDYLTQYYTSSYCKCSRHYVTGRRRHPLCLCSFFFKLRNNKYCYPKALVQLLFYW